MFQIISFVSIAIALLVTFTKSYCPLNCIQCINQRCTYCMANYALTTDGMCIQPTIAGCAVFKSATQCYLCRPELVLVNNLCELDSSGCVQRNTITRVCSKCSYGKFLALGTCFGILNCKIYEGINCQKCFDGFKKKVDGNKTTCQPDLFNPNSHCVQVSSQSQHCQKCAQGYQKKGLICIPNQIIKPRCAVYDQAFLCISCEIGLQLYQDQCLTQQQVKMKLLLKIKSVDSLGSQSKTNLIRYQSAIASEQNKDSSAIVVRGVNFGGVSSSKSDSGCFYLSNGTCLKCLKQYQLVGGYCIIAGCIKIVDHQCKNCKQGYQLKDKKCIQKVLINVGQASLVTKADMKSRVIQHCKVLNLRGQCTKCNQGYFPKDGICRLFYERCKTSSPVNGACLSCYDGYKLVDENCIQKTSDPNCNKFVNDKCQQCAERFYLQFGTGICLPIDKNCKDYHIFTGKCRLCYEGYQLKDGKCVTNSQLSQKTSQNSIKITKQAQIDLKAFEKSNKTNTQSNGSNNSTSFFSFGSNSQISAKVINCRVIDKITGRCAQCYQGYFLKDGIQCQILDPLCKTHNLSTGLCQSCWQGYNLAQGKCVLGASNTQAQTNKQDSPNLTTQQQTIRNKNIQNCRKIKDGVCQECSFGFYLQKLAQNSIIRCVQIDPSCKNFSIEVRKCTQCYEGYQVSSNQPTKCRIKLSKKADPFCQIFDQSLSTCRKCTQRYYLNSRNLKQQKCEPVSILCKQYTQDTGKCKSCIDDHVFQQGQCIRPSLGVDQNCVFYESGYCSKCKEKFELNNYKCVGLDTAK